MTADDSLFMKRCLQLALLAEGQTSPNPMVGAVVVAAGRIIGEGYHHRAGQPHAEVNAVNSIAEADECLLRDATIYVSLEPCSHYGKTPPCANLILEKGIRRVVVGCRDPFSKVNGKGIAMLREAGVEVTEGIMEAECKWINRRFFTFHQSGRPYITLKWAQTADGFLDCQGQAMAISSDFSRLLVHKMRAAYDAILVGRITDEREHPALTVRHWTGKSPRRFVLSHQSDIDSILEECRQHNLQSLIVEGGRLTLQSFIDRGLVDCIRRETAPMTVGTGTPAPSVPEWMTLTDCFNVDGRRIDFFEHK